MTYIPVTYVLVLLFLGETTSCNYKLFAGDVLSSDIFGILDYYYDYYCWMVPFESIWICGCFSGCKGIVWLFLSLESEPILLEVKLFVLGYCFKDCGAGFSLRWVSGSLLKKLLIDYAFGDLEFARCCCCYYCY